MATSCLSRRPFLLQASSIPSSRPQRVSWRRHLELEIQRLSISHRLNKICQWMSEHYSVTTRSQSWILKLNHWQIVSRTDSIRLGVTTLYHVSSLFFLPILELEFISHFSVGPPPSSIMFLPPFFESACQVLSQLGAGVFFSLPWTWISLFLPTTVTVTVVCQCHHNSDASTSSTSSYNTLLILPLAMCIVYSKNCTNDLFWPSVAHLLISTWNQTRSHGGHRHRDWSLIKCYSAY